MPRFFFNIHDGKSILDHEGAELPDCDAAGLAAVSIAGRIMADEPERIAVGEEWTVEVTDGTGLVLFRIDVCVMASPAVRSDRLAKERLDRDRANLKT